MAISTLASELRLRLNLGELPSGGCDLCAGVPLAPDSQLCDHRCKCGRQLICEHGEPDYQKWSEQHANMAKDAIYGALRVESVGESLADFCYFHARQAARYAREAKGGK